jgi:hypothetical protein
MIDGFCLAWCSGALQVYKRGCTANDICQHTRLAHIASKFLLINVGSSDEIVTARQHGYNNTQQHDIQKSVEEGTLRQVATVSLCELAGDAVYGEWNSDPVSPRRHSPIYIGTQSQSQGVIHGGLSKVTSWVATGRSSS